MVDWSAGEYERTATELEPAARRVIECAAIVPGERVLDVACGTGNAALAAAAAGARVTGLDSAPRLVEVARQRAGEAGADAEFVVGDALDLPFDDGTFDAVVSVFGVIFAPDAERAVGEMRRVLAPGGRIVLSAWQPDGAVHRMVGVLGRGLVAAGAPSRPSFAWHDPDAIAGLAAARGAAVDAEDAGLPIRGDSPEAYFAIAENHHPMSLAGRPLLERAGTYPALREEAIGVLRDANEDAGAFRVTSPYRVIRLIDAAVTR
jgi:SAM-dependent methyltransferase